MSAKHPKILWIEAMIRWCEQHSAYPDWVDWARTRVVELQNEKPKPLPRKPTYKLDSLL